MHINTCNYVCITKIQSSVPGVTPQKNALLQKIELEFLLPRYSDT